MIKMATLLKMVRHGKWRLLDFSAILAIPSYRLRKPFCGFATCVLACDADILSLRNHACLPSFKIVSFHVIFLVCLNPKMLMYFLRL